jgi:hypothetical protein
MSSTKHTSVRDHVRTLADEVRLKAHLAGMDAKKAWEGIEPRLRHYEQRVGAAGDKIADDVTKAGEELTLEMRKLLDKLPG